jgi:death on curing protein
LATEETIYLSFDDALLLHFALMWLYGKTRFGVFEPDLIESALARPRHAAVYESADLIRQAATLCFGLIKNHPWVGGNKRTATAIVDEFLLRNGYVVSATLGETAKLALAVESTRFGVDEIEAWYRQHTTFTGKST